MAVVALEARKVLQSLARLGLLLAGESDAMPHKRSTRRDGQVKCFVGHAFHRKLQDARPIRVEPQLRRRLSADGFVELEFGFCEIDRSERRKGIEVQPLRRILRVKRTLLMREELMNTAL